MNFFQKHFARAAESGVSMEHYYVAQKHTHESIKTLLRGSTYFLIENVSVSSDFYNQGPGLYPFSTEIVEASNKIIQKRYNHSESCVTLKVS